MRCEIKGKCEALASILRLIPANFPTELQHGSLEYGDDKIEKDGDIRKAGSGGGRKLGCQL